MKLVSILLCSLVLLLLWPAAGNAQEGGAEAPAATYQIEVKDTTGFSQDAGILSLPGAQGSLTSPVYVPGWEFIAVGVTWDVALPPKVTPLLEVRVSQDGANWSGWTPLELGGADRPQHASGNYTELLFLRGRQAQLRATLNNLTGTPVHWQGLRLTLLKGGTGPTAQELSARASSGSGPAIISRAAWGANESYRFNNSGNEIWPREYHTLRALFVHHTYRPLPTYPDPAEAVRATYYYHAVTLGWGDIGYHYIIDQYGNIYQGRYGGESNGLVVEGGHALGYNRNTMGVSMIGDYTSAMPNSAMMASLQSLLADRASTYGINPQSSVWLDGVGSISPDRWFNYSILGHRDTHNPARTTCPGQTLWEYLPTLRANVSGQIGQGPQVQLVTPGRDSVLAGNVTLQVTASATISRVEYYLDNSLIAVSLSAPWSVQVDAASLPAGAWSLKAVGYTASGASASVESPVTVARVTPPTALSSTPAAVAAPAAMPASARTATAQRAGAWDHHLYLPSLQRQSGARPVVQETPPTPPASGGQRCEQLPLPNGSFDTNTDWAMTMGDYAARYVANERVWSVPRSLRVGMAPGDNRAGWSSARLPFTIPADATDAVLSLRYLPQTGNVYGSGRQAIGLLDGQGTYIRSIIPMGLRHESEWQSVSYNLNEFIGQTIYIYVGVENTGANPTRLYADDVRVMICRP